MKGVVGIPKEDVSLLKRARTHHHKTRTRLLPFLNGKDWDRDKKGKERSQSSPKDASKIGD